MKLITYSLIVSLFFIKTTLAYSTQAGEVLKVVEYNENLNPRLKPKSGTEKVVGYYMGMPGCSPGVIHLTVNGTVDNPKLIVSSNRVSWYRAENHKVITGEEWDALPESQKWKTRQSRNDDVYGIRFKTNLEGENPPVYAVWALEPSHYREFHVGFRG